MGRMDSRVVLVTGATNGIGKATALALAGMGATTIIVGRRRERADATVEYIRHKTGNQRVEAMLADLSSMAEVRRLADQFKSKYPKLHVLVNNAGALFTARKTTVDGYERTFALNHLNYFLLTNLLLDVIKASTPARIVNVASDAHKGGRLNWDDLNGERRYLGLAAYAQSKLANIVFTYELARRLEGSGVTANALHPGFVRSGFGRNNGAILRVIMTIIQAFTIGAEEGARTSIYLASSPEVEGITGKYWIKSRVVPSNHASQDRISWTRLWEISEKMTAIEPT